jgi:ABC-type glutathione transport system ATPase component
MSALLKLEGLTIRYGDSAAVKGLSLSIAKGRCLGIVGESGSGKSQTGLAIMGLLPKAADLSGALLLDGEALIARARRTRVAMVFQDPQSAFTPHLRIGAQIAEAMASPSQAAIEAALQRAGLPDPVRVARSYPHELSGGMRQRAMLAMALARQPDLIVADEPTTALDATVQMELLGEFAAVKASGTAMILISHDIGVVAGLADDIIVMREGDVVEQASAQTLLSAPEHPYTRDLIAASVIRRSTQPLRVTRDAPLVEGKGLSKRYPLARPLPFLPAKSLQALAPLDVALYKGETLAIVGESGSGKSTLAKLLLGLETPSTGDVLWQGKNIAQMPAAALRQARAKVQPVFQDPFASFDPQRRLGQSIQDAINLHATQETLEALLAAVNLPPDFAQKYPHEASGGQNQRAAIARALASTPDILICDEALSALDKTTQGQVLDVLAQLKTQRGLSMVFVSHDLDVVAAIADRILILKDGEVVEEGSVRGIYDGSRQAYTRALIDAQTVPDVETMRAKISAIGPAAPAL